MVEPRTSATFVLFAAYERALASGATDAAAWTRAQQCLIFTAAQRRTLADRTVENRPCPFLDDLPADLLATSRAASRRRKARQLSLLD